MPGLYSFQAYPQSTAVLSGSGAPGSFFTTFAADENPISESGAWAHNAIAWQKVQTVSGVAHAAAYTELLDDAYAYLVNWVGNDYEVIATVDFPSGTGGEVELLMRCSDSATQVHTFELLYNVGSGGWQIVRWNGNLADITVLNAGGTTPSAPNGAQIRGTVVGNLITFYWRAVSTDGWTTLGTADATSYPTGQPGLSIYVHAVDNNRLTVGFADYAVTAL